MVPPLPTVRLAAIAGALWVPCALAEVVDPFEEPDESASFRLEEQMVTVASRYAQTTRQAPSIVTVITDREIRERGHRTLTDLLRTLPGVYISTAPEGFSLAWFRGTISPDNNKFLLLVDGVPWYDGIYTHAWIDEYLPLENVRQVEVIKGPGSAIYGTNAFSGVVNVVTYRAADLEGGFARVVGGSRARIGGAVVAGDYAVTARGTPVSVSGIVRYLDTDGDGLEVNPSGQRNVTGNHPRRAVNAGIRVEAGGLSVALDAVDYRHTYFTQAQDDTFDVLVQSVDEFQLGYRDLFLSTRYRFDAGRHLRITPYLYAQEHDNPGQYAWISDPSMEETDDGGWEASWDTTLVETEKHTFRWGTGLEVQARPGLAHVLVGGMGVEANHVLALQDLTFEDLEGEGDTDGFRLDARADSVLHDTFLYLQDTWMALYWLELTAGLRVDRHSVSGTFASPRAGLLLVPAPRSTVKLLYGRAFRAPTARELLVVVDQDEEGSNRWTAGNRDLDHERIDTVELQWLQELGNRIELRASTLYSGIDDEIDKRFTDEADPRWGDAYYDNFEGSDVFGAELESELDLGTLEFDGSYTWTHAVDRTTGFTQYAFPPHMAHFRLTWRITDEVRTSLLADAYGRRPRAAWSPDAGLEDGDPYTLLHAALATDLLAGGRMRADVSVHNLLDTEYQMLIYRDDANEVEEDGSPSYPRDLEGPGRSVVVGLEMAF